MKKLLLVFIALLCMLPVTAQEEGERIRSFDSRVTANDDGSMLVRETITVQSAGEQIRHGIYREFPTRYTNLRWGTHYSVGFDIVSLQRDARDEPYRTEDLSNGVRVYFGSSSYDLPPGTHTYVFAYRTKGQLGFFADHDELYWNATGLGWGFPIDAATATVVLPQRVRNLVTGLDAYTGSEGEKGNRQAAADRRPPGIRAQDLPVSLRRRLRRRSAILLRAQFRQRRLRRHPAAEDFPAAAVAAAAAVAGKRAQYVAE